MNESNQVPNPVIQPALPNATAALVLGILSIVTCWCFGIIGMILGIIGLVMGIKAVALYKQSPGVYSEASYKNANAGKICAIIGLALSALYIIRVIVTWSATMALVRSIVGGSFSF